jgi:hypothetical protein
MADITITVPDTAIPRVQDAFQKLLNLPGPATLADVKDYIINDLKQVTKNSEERIQRDALVPPDDVDYT